jgi:hypothetical protein
MAAGPSTPLKAARSRTRPTVGKKGYLLRGRDLLNGSIESVVFKKTGKVIRVFQFAARHIR